MISNSSGSTGTESIDTNLEEEHKRTARLVWNRHTNPSSELSRAKRRLADREMIDKSKSEPSGGLASGGIKRLEEATPKYLVKKNLEKEAIYQDMEKATTFTKIESKEHSERSKKYSGLDKNQLLIAVMMILMCFILYSVLLHLTMKAAQ